MTYQHLSLGEITETHGSAWRDFNGSLLPGAAPVVGKIGAIASPPSVQVTGTKGEMPFSGSMIVLDFTEALDHIKDPEQVSAHVSNAVNTARDAQITTQE